MRHGREAWLSSAQQVKNDLSLSSSVGKSLRHEARPSLLSSSSAKEESLIILRYDDEHDNENNDTNFDNEDKEHRLYQVAEEGLADDLSDTFSKDQ
jgi:hypothetical protein